MGHPYLNGPYPRAYAHRGWHTGDLAGLENTMAAFRRAVEEGFRYLELDVRLTADGVVVVHHNPNVEDRTPGAGLIARLPYSALRKVRVGGREQIPRLSDVLEELPEARVTIELKSDAVVAPVLRLLHASDAWHRVCLGSFSERRVEIVRRAGGGQVLTSLGRRSAFALRARAWLDRSTTAPGLPVHGALAQLPRRYGRLAVVDPALVRTAHGMDLEVHVWTVNDPAEMRALLDLGVDGLLSDRPDLLRAVLQDRGQWPPRVRDR